MDTKMHIFGVISAFMFAVEFQKRWVPHIHLLIISEDRYKRNIDEINEVTSAEIPPIESPIYNILKNHMNHNPCLHMNNKSPCLKYGQCSKHFPKPLISENE